MLSDKIIIVINYCFTDIIYLLLLFALEENTTEEDMALTASHRALLKANLQKVFI